MTDGKIQQGVGTINQPRILFKPGSWLAKIDFINHLILFNNVLITVLSEKEGGKTCFSSLLQSNLDQQIKSVAISVKPPCEQQHIINEIAAQLHLNNDANTTVASIVAQINERKAHVLLIIDDAQHLPEAFIKEAMIAIKNQGDFGFFHLCLVSDYSVVATLNNLAVDQFNNLIHSIEIGALNESETRTYILQRAMTAGLINKPLSDAQYKQFYQLTKGNLAKINSSLESFLFTCSNEKKTTKRVSIKKTSIAISLLAAAGLGYLYVDKALTEAKYPQMAMLTSPPAIKDIVGDIKPQLASQIPSWLDSSTRQLVHFALPKKQDLDDPLEEDTLNTVAIVDKVLVIPTVKPKDAVVNAALASAVQVANNESQLVKVDIATNEKSGMAPAKPMAEQTVAGLYTIQLVASHAVADVNRFRQSNKLFANTKVRHFTNSKGSWYILTLGEFNSRAKAQSEANSLPADLAKLKPWIRPTQNLKSIS